MYTVIGSPRSRAMRVLWAVEELGEDYAYNPAPPRSEVVQTAHALGKVPLLQDGDATLFDSVAILTYLADKHGKLTAPPGTLARARQDAMTQYAVAELDAVLWTRTRHSFILPEEERVPEVKPSLDRELARNFEQLGLLIGEDPFAAGDSFTIADILISHCSSWAQIVKVPMPEGPVGEYLKRMRSRPALRRALERAAAVE